MQADCRAFAGVSAMSRHLNVQEKQPVIVRIDEEPMGHMSPAERHWYSTLIVLFIVGGLIWVILLLVGCASAETDDGAIASGEARRTRTVCVRPDAQAMRAVTLKAIDAWNDRDTAPLCTECAAWDRCLCKAVAHELGHALGIHYHTSGGMMGAESIRSDVQGLTRRDVQALPWNAPHLLFVDFGSACTTAIGWGYPEASVPWFESAWYELRTKDIWIDPAKRWVY